MKEETFSSDEEPLVPFGEGWSVGGGKEDVQEEKQAPEGVVGAGDLDSSLQK